MSKIAEIFRTYAQEYIERFGDSMPANHKKVIDSILNCRTETSGTLIYQCKNCKTIHHVYRSCGIGIALFVKITKPFNGMKNKLNVNYLGITL